MNFEELLKGLGVHTPKVLERFCGNQTLLQSFILKFPAEKTFAELSSAYEEGRFDDAERGVHTLKGIAANLGFEALSLHCADMLDDLRGTRSALPDKFARISAEYRRLTDGISSYVAAIHTEHG